jgi:hypothetical protein
MTYVADGDGRNARSVVAISASKLFREMHGIAMTAAVSARQYFAIVFDAINHDMGSCPDVLHLLFIVHEGL